MVESRVTQVNTVRMSSAIGHDVAREFSLGALGCNVGLSSRNFDAFSHQLEVVNEGFHVLTHNLAHVLKGVALTVVVHGEVGGARDLRIFNHEGLALCVGETIAALPADLQGFVHFGEANTEGAVGVAGVPDRNVEVVGFVSEVGLLLPEVPFHASGA